MDKYRNNSLILHACRQQSQARGQRARLYLAIRELILTQRLNAGALLPSSRALAAELAIGRNTVVRAYDQLITEGYLTGSAGSGTYVSMLTHTPDVSSAKQRPRPQTPPQLSRRGQALLAAAASSRVQGGAFMPGVPDVSQFPFATWRRLLARQIRFEQRHLAQYGYGGYGPLKTVLADYVNASRMMACQPGQIIIVNGAHQALDLCAKILADAGDTAWMEDPGYWGARNILASANLHVEPIGVDADGIAPSASDWQKPPRMIFVSPSSQYPTGVVLSLERRLRLLEYAQQNAAWIIEDDYDSEVRFQNNSIASLFGLSTTQRVIYIGTFSKTMYPGLRLAWMVVPQNLVDSFAAANAELYREGRLHEQAALAEFIDNGHFSRHLRRMRALYRERREILQTQMEQLLGGLIQPCASTAGLHLPVRFQQPLDDCALAAQAMAEGVLLRPLSRYALAAENRIYGMNLGFAAVASEHIAAPAQSLARLVIQMAQQGERRSR